LRAWRFHLGTYDPLDTTGSQTFGGRWNPRGVPVVYASQTFAGGLLELLAHVSVPRRAPRDHVASLLEIPDDAEAATLDPPFRRGWNDLQGPRIARSLAEPWLSSGSELCLIVPSVPGAPVERNVVIDARHPRFGEVVVMEQVKPELDDRIWA
jgi:RES domain-containing protein